VKMWRFWCDSRWCNFCSSKKCFKKLAQAKISH